MVTEAIPMQIKSDPKKIWRKIKQNCEHKVEDVFAVDCKLTGSTMFSECKCKSSVIFN